MRLWSIHPGYLDRRGLVALWREALLAQAVLRKQTVGYRHHPQLGRFRRHNKPLQAINAYLWYIYQEAIKRGYSFDRKKVRQPGAIELIELERGQVDYEIMHLLSKLKQRDPEKYKILKSISRHKSHPLFRIVPGQTADWEKPKN